MILDLRCQPRRRCVRFTHPLQCAIHCSSKMLLRNLVLVLCAVLAQSQAHPSSASPPTLPVAFQATITRRTRYGDSPPEIANLTLYLDLPKNKQHIEDYTYGYPVQSWSLYNLKPAQLYTLDKENIPPPGCTCITASPPLLPEFYDLRNASLRGHETIRGEACEKWLVRNEIISGDFYYAWVKVGTNVPLRTRWIDPSKPQNATIIETTDYLNFVNKAPPSDVFEPKGACKKVKCNDAAIVKRRHKWTNSPRRERESGRKWLALQRTLQ